MPGNRGEKIKRTESPVLDNEVLLNLEKDFLENRTETNWEKLWKFSLKVCGKFLRDIYRNRNVFVDPEDIHDKALEAVGYVLPRLSDPFYVMDRNLSSQLWLGCRRAVDYTMEVKSTRLEAEAVRMARKTGTDFWKCCEMIKAEWERNRNPPPAEDEQGWLFTPEEMGG